MMIEIAGGSRRGTSAAKKAGALISARGRSVEGYWGIGPISAEPVRMNVRYALGIFNAGMYAAKGSAGTIFTTLIAAHAIRKNTGATWITASASMYVPEESAVNP